MTGRSLIGVDDDASYARVRHEPERLRFEVEARDGAARAGVLHTAHGPVETPAFIPLATKGTVRGLESAEVAELGYELILGNTYHLFVSPGPDRIADAGGLHGFMGWERALITDSGGFQVFSLAHGGVANEVKGSGRPGGEQGSVVSIGEEGVRFRSYRDGTSLFISPEVSMEVQAKLGSDIALVFDECTPYHADREYTARSTERTHRWLDRCLDGTARTGPSGRPCSGSSRAGSTRTCGGSRRRPSPRPASTGSRSAGTLGRDKEEMREVLGFTAPLLPEAGAQAPARHRRGGRPARRDRPRPRRLRLRRPDPPRPPRRSPRPKPRNPLPPRPPQVRLGGDRDPLVEGCPCPACQHHDRDYLSYLSRAEELTAVRLICLHNLTYMHQLTTHARTAITAGSFTSYAAHILAGEYLGALRPPLVSGRRGPLLLRCSF